MDEVCLETNSHSEVVRKGSKCSKLMKFSLTPCTPSASREAGKHSARVLSALARVGYRSNRFHDFTGDPSSRFPLNFFQNNRLREVRLMGYDSICIGWIIFYISVYHIFLYLRSLIGYHQEILEVALCREMMEQYKVRKMILSKLMM